MLVYAQAQEKLTSDSSMAMIAHIERYIYAAGIMQIEQNADMFLTQ